MEFPLNSWIGEQNFYINLRGVGENFIEYTRTSSNFSSPQVVNDLYLINANISSKQ